MVRSPEDTSFHDEPFEDALPFASNPPTTPTRAASEADEWFSARTTLSTNTLAARAARLQGSRHSSPGRPEARHINNALDNTLDLIERDQRAKKRSAAEDFMRETTKTTKIMQDGTANEGMPDPPHDAPAPSQPTLPPDTNPDGLSLLLSAPSLAALLGPLVLGPDIIGPNYGPLDPHTDYNAFFTRIQDHGNAAISRALTQFMRDVRNAYVPGAPGNAMLYLFFNVWRGEQTAAQEGQLRKYMGSVRRWLRGEIAREEIEIVREVEGEAERRYLAHGRAVGEEGEEEEADVRPGGNNAADASPPPLHAQKSDRRSMMRIRQSENPSPRTSPPPQQSSQRSKPTNPILESRSTSAPRTSLVSPPVYRPRKNLSHRQRRAKTSAFREAARLRGTLPSSRPKSRLRLEVPPLVELGAKRGGGAAVSRGPALSSGTALSMRTRWLRVGKGYS